MNGYESNKSFGELPTLGHEEPSERKVRAEGPSWSEREMSRAETLRPPEGIRDDGRTDAARRWTPGETILDRYVVERELGQGGMGVVYGCLDRVGGVRVAVKCLPPELSHNSVEMEEVRENFQLVYGLSHPNIAGVRQLERDWRGEYFLVMEEAAGESLRRWLRAKWKAGGVTVAEAVPILRQVASALDYAHGEKVIHRDVKPGNVMIDARGRVKVLDFGLASQIRTSLSRASHAYRGTSGTGPYMAPEQWRGRRQDGKTDQYALGVMAYEILSGHLPFENEEVSVLREVVLKEEPEDISGVPEGAMAAIRRAMSKNAADRFPACRAFVDALESAASQGRASTPCEPEKGSAAVGSAGTSAGKPARTTARPEGSPHHHRKGWSFGGWVAAAVVAAAVGAGVWWGGWGRETARPESAFPDAGGTPALPVEEEAPGAFSDDLLALPPEGASRNELEDALARLEARRDALVQEGYAVADPERAPVEAALAVLEGRLDAALEAEAEKARAAEREGRRAAAQRAADLEALGDLKKAVDRRMASLDSTWQDGLFGKKRKAIADARKKLEACTDAASLAKAKELRGDIYDAVDWIERNTPARSGLSDAEKALEALAGACTATDAGRLAGGSFHKADRARKEGEKHRDAGRFEDAVAEYATAKGFYETALKEARCAKAVACVDEARTYAKSKMWTECMEAAVSALAWDADNAEAKQLKEDAERAALAEKVDQGLEAAREAERRGAWKEVIAAAKGVLALDAGNAEASRMKEAAERQLKPSILLKATLNGREVAATVTEGLARNGLTTPVTVNLEAGGSYSFAAEYEAWGKKYAGRVTVKAKARGVTDAALVLEEVKVAAAGDVFALDLGGGVKLDMVYCPGVAADFWMGKYEVTQKQWKQVTGKSPSHFGGRPENPVENVSLYDCLDFVEALNALPAAQDSGLAFRLPGEREWETACRAGAPESADYCKLENGAQITLATLYRVARYGKGWDEGPVAVGSLQPNAWGLHDMHGNVWEWTQTWDGGSSVLRGGSFDNAAWDCTAGYRYGNHPGYASRCLGLRLAASGRPVTR